MRSSFSSGSSRLSLPSTKAVISRCWTPSYEIVDAIQNGVRWEPIFTPALAARYHLDHFAQLHPPGGPPPSGASRSPHLPPPTPAGGGLVLTPPAGPGGAIVPNPIVLNPNPNDNRTVNTNFNEALLGSYKVSSIKCKALRDKILQQNPKPGSSSKVQSQPLRANVLGLALQGAMQHELCMCCGSCPVQRPHESVVCYWLCSSSTSRLTLRREDYGRNFKAKLYFYNSSVATNITSHPSYNYSCPIQSTRQTTCAHL